MNAGALTENPPEAAESERARRMSLVQRHLRDEGLAALVLASPENVYYLTGLDHLGYFACTLLVVPQHGPPTLLTRTMERPTVRAQVPQCRHATFDDGQPAGEVAASVLAGLVGGDAAVAFDDESMFFPPAVAAAIEQRLPRLRRCPGSPLLSGMRAVKSDVEIGAVREAAALSDAGMAAGLAAARAGGDEPAVAAEVYRAMITGGGRPPGFPPLIRPTSLIDQEHVTWSGRALTRGQGLLLELAGSARRYHAPLTRTVYIGHAPPGAAEASGIALDGLRAAREALRPGARTGEVYAAWSRAVSDGGTPAPERHHCGYLVGIGFPPSWSGGASVQGLRSGGTERIAAGMTVHLMSWITRPVGHVLSDTVLVTPDGAETLTTTPRELTVL